MASRLIKRSAYVLLALAGVVVLVLVSLVTKPKPEEELRGLVWGLTRKEERDVDVDPRDKLWLFELHPTDSKALATHVDQLEDKRQVALKRERAELIRRFYELKDFKLPD